MTAIGQTVVKTPKRPDGRETVPRLGRRIWNRTRLFRPVMILVAALILFFALTQPVFLTSANLSNLLSSVAALWVLSLGMTFVVITGGVDLSVAAIASLGGIFLAKTIDAGVPAWFAFALSIIFCAGVGAVVNGVLIGWLRLSFFVVTIASMTALTGVVSLWSNAESFYVTSPFIVAIGGGSFLGFPIPVWIMVLMFALFLYVQSRTFFGRDVFAVGGSFSASRLSGIPTTRTIVIVYAVSGAMAGLAGVMASGRVGAATPQIDGSLPLLAVAAVLLGGTSLLGGIGGVGGTALGVLFVSILQNGLSIAGVQSFWQQVITGVILVAAVLGDRIPTARRLAFRTRALSRSVTDRAESDRTT